MTWRGISKVAADAQRYVGGKLSGDVRDGDALVPRFVHNTFTGQRGDPNLSARFEYRDIDGHGNYQPTCVELHITTKRDGRGITAQDLADLGLDRLTVAVFDQLTMHVVGEPVGRRRELLPGRAPRSQGGPRSELELAASVYRKHIDGSPVVAVQQALTTRRGDEVSHRTAARRVAQAREAGLLPATDPGIRKA